MATKDSGNDCGWWSDPETVNPPYLDPEPGQAGSDLDFFCANQMGFANGQYPNGTKVSMPDYDNDGH